ncbi:F-box protein CPR1-like [Rhododendron vialii]|uniref:F-box protein CPR1-like n=1 Tax=Rhododendron vialii TaxID=182163 RepID=UPI00265EEE18|nr:F-box protein CPR1-like [Rhododendron vialii]
MQDLSDDIILDVLSRLPVVSLSRFRCVSKSWRSLISHPHFIKTHLNRSTNDKHERLLLCGNYNWFSVEIISSQFGHQSLAARLNFAPDRNPTCCHEICCSCDGLVLMLDVGLHYFVVNPSTRESRELPKPPLSNAFDHYGLGYDSSIDDYKVVNISSYDRETECADNVVSVYAL